MGREKAPEFHLVTRAGCHLCEEMAAVLGEVLPRYGLEHRPVDVDGDPALTARFGEVVPVLLRDGLPVAKVRITRRELERIVRRRAR